MLFLSPLWNSTQSQESKYEVCAQEFYAAMRIKTYLDNALYLSSLLSDLSMFKVNHQIINDRLYRCTVFIISVACLEHLRTTLSLQKRQLVSISGRTPRDSPWEGRRRRGRPTLTNKNGNQTNVFLCNNCHFCRFVVQHCPICI